MKRGVAVVLGRYVVDAVVLEGRSPTELARSHGLSRTWIYELVKRFRRGGYAALEPRSRRPRSCPHQHGPEVEQAVLTLRRSLADAGHDAGAQTIALTCAARSNRSRRSRRSGGSSRATA
ncbi:MAG: helix-turn-helix domain-containing protein [Chloroflexota bacterium]|nr:helix-turn-helix domain-containing protein [Chloroflexota bacterium]